jgi:drug/metabolite transporter (DMT)-like permease
MDKTNSAHRVPAIIGLVFTTIVWGSGFVVMKNAVDDITPIYLMAFRFTVASVGMIALLFAERARKAGKSGKFRKFGRAGAAAQNYAALPMAAASPSEDGAPCSASAPAEAATAPEAPKAPEAAAATEAAAGASGAPEAAAATWAPETSRASVAAARTGLGTGIFIGFWLFMSYVTQTYGLKYTTASNNAFITTFYVIIVPFLNAAANKARLRVFHLAAAATALAGLALLSLDGAFAVRLGDGLTLACSLCYAIHIVLLDRHSPRYSPIFLTTVQMCSVAAFCWITAPIFEGAPPIGAFSPTIIMNLLYLGVFATMIGFLLQTFGQKYLPAMAVTILLTLECVFGAMFSVIFLHDPLTPRIVLGFALMFAAVAITVSPKKPIDFA